MSDRATESPTGRSPAGRPRIAVWKFASCDGCQLSLVSAESDLLALADEVEIAHFLELSREVGGGPYDISIVEGSITTPGDRERIRHVRAVSDVLVTIGACATAGGIQALRNFADADELRATVYARPPYVDTLATSTAIADHVEVDVELRGCPVEADQVVEVLSAHLAARRPVLPTHSVCVECKLRGAVCVAVAGGQPCLGPVTQAGCGARCPAFGRACYGCFGPMESADPAALADHLAAAGTAAPELLRLFRTFNADAPAFREESERQADAAAGAQEVAT